jgi:tRNA threonylcarbamoyl adenosine modification protein (Sua5/YciO/YrdC/YwlC family)
MLLQLHPVNPQPRNIKTIIECLSDGGVIVYPTDTIYGLGCDISQHKAVERICRIKQVDPAKAQLSFICYDLSDLSNYTKSISTPLYRLLKTLLPGPYTFILPASKLVPKILKSRKDTIGLRIPDNIIARSLVKELGRPILSSSLPGDFAGGQGSKEKSGQGRQQEAKDRDAAGHGRQREAEEHGTVGHGRQRGDDREGPGATSSGRRLRPLPEPAVAGPVPAVPMVEEYTDPEMIQEKFGALVDIVVDGGIGGVLPSTVIDCTGDEPVLIRKGLGTWEPQTD